MRIKVRKETFEEALVRASCALGDKKSAQITQCFGLESSADGFSVVASRADASAKVTIPKSDDLEVSDFGQVVVDGATLVKGISSLHDGVMISVEEEVNDDGDGNQITCAYKTRNEKKWDHSFATLEGESFPDVDFSWTSKQSVEYPADKLIKFVSKVSFAASDEDSQANYAVVYSKFDDSGLFMCATDGRQLASIRDSSCSFSEGREIILNAKIISSIARKNILDENFDVKISVQENKGGSKIKFEQDGLSIVSGLPSDVKKIPYNVITDMDGKICEFKVNSGELKQDLKSLFSTEFKETIWSFGEDGIKVKNVGSSAKRGGGQIDGVTNFDGEPCELVFSLRYWEYLLSRASGNDDLNVRVRNKRAPIDIQVTPEPEKYNYYIMPITAAD